MSPLSVTLLLVALGACAAEDPIPLTENVPRSGIMTPTGMHYFSYEVGAAENGMEVHVDLTQAAGRIDIYLKCGANPGIRPGEFELEHVGQSGQKNYLYVPNPKCVDKPYHILLYGFDFYPRTYAYSVHANSNGTKELWPFVPEHFWVPSNAYHYYKLPLVRISNFVAIADVVESGVSGSTATLLARYDLLPTTSSYTARDTIRYKSYKGCIKIKKPQDSTMYLGVYASSYRQKFKIQVILNGPSDCEFIDIGFEGAKYLELEPLDANEINRLLAADK